MARKVMNGLDLQNQKIIGLADGSAATDAVNRQQLDAAIREAGIANPSPKLRKSARKLFACALETPGGLKVQTIHALCTRLLQQFPFEANVPARFAVLDDRDQNEMMERANLAVLLEASREPDSVMGRALARSFCSLGSASRS